MPDSSSNTGPRIPRRGSSTIHLLPRHREVIRLTILGWTPIRIAAAVGLQPVSVKAILRAPLVQAEMERLQDEADRLTVNVPLRAQVEGELRGATVQALRLNRRLMSDANVDARTRSNVAKHFMDRVLFDIDTDSAEKNSGYREILRKLDEVDKSLGRGVWYEAVPSPESIDGQAKMGAGPETARPVSPRVPSPPSDQEVDITDAIKDKLGIIP
jgi:hypothetical protein